MKINKILETIVDTKIHPDQRYHGFLRQDAKGTTNSVYSKVKDVKNEPHMVRKYNHRPMDKYAHKRNAVDGFNYFIEQLIEKEETDNIHFPKVYSMKKIVDDNDNFIHTYDIEKLIPGFRLTKDELVKVCTESFGEEEGSDQYDEDDLQRIIAGKIIYAIEKNDYTDIISDSLIEALNIITDIIKSAVKIKRGHRLDIHSDNIMYRRTPYGVQLVINDPIA